MSEFWRLELLDNRDNKKADLPKVISGSLDWSIFRSIPGAGSIELSRHDVDISWLTDRIRVIKVENGLETPLGIYIPQIPGWDQDGPVTKATLSLSDKCELLNSQIGAWITYPLGANPVALVNNIIRARGETAVQFVDTAETLRAPASFEPEATWLEVVNTLLGAINYGSLWVDANGFFRLEPYVAPEERILVATYGSTAEGHYRTLDAWGDQADLDVPTGFRIYVPGDDNTPGLIGKADLPPDNPLSAAARGREVLITESGEATSQAIANQIAARRLGESIQITRKVTIKHPLDGTQINDVVRHAPLDFTGPIVQREIDMGLGAVVTDTIRRIYTGGELPWR